MSHQITGTPYGMSFELLSWSLITISSQMIDKLLQENEILGNMISSLKSSGDEHNSEHQAVNKLSTPKRKKKDEDLLNFLKDTSNRINAIESNLSQNPITSRSYTEDNIHCLEQQIHKLEMDKIESLKYSQKCVSHLQEIVNSQQLLQQKISHLENENMRLRQTEFDRQNETNQIKQDHENMTLSESVSNLSFEDIIDRVMQIEKENKSTRSLQTQMEAMSHENMRLRQRIIECQNDNQALFEKYNVTLQQYQLLCKQYLK